MHSDGQRTRKHYGDQMTLNYRPQRSCGQGNSFTPICHSDHGGGLPQCMLGYPLPRRSPLPRRPPAKETPLPRRPPCQGDPPAKRPPCQGDPPAKRPPCQETPLPRRPPSKETPPPRRPPSRPTSKGEIEGDQIQAHTQGGN